MFRNSCGIFLSRPAQDHKHRSRASNPALLTYLPTPWSSVPLEKLTGFQLVKKFPAFYGTRRFITAFTTARQLSISWASSIQSIPPHPTSWSSILILSSHLRLDLPCDFFPSGFPDQNPIYASPIPHARYIPRPFHSFRFYNPNNNGWAVQIQFQHELQNLSSPTSMKRNHFFPFAGLFRSANLPLFSSFIVVCICHHSRVRRTPITASTAQQVLHNCER
jgi:hypothetical protein